MKTKASLIILACITLVIAQSQQQQQIMQMIPSKGGFNIVEHSCSHKPTFCKGINKVCGLFNPKFIVCAKFPCGQTFDNKCEACSDSRIISYIDKPCEEINRPVEQKIAMQVDNGTIQQDDGIPVQQHNGTPVQQDNGKSKAGSDLSILRDSHVCVHGIKRKCITLYDPVCGLVYDQNLNFKEFTTYSNSCIACNNDNVEIYIDGSCEDLIMNDKPSHSRKTVEQQSEAPKTKSFTRMKMPYLIPVHQQQAQMKGKGIEY